MEQECSRLTEGFKKSIGSSPASKILFDMKSSLTTPQWQKSPNWVVGLPPFSYIIVNNYNQVSHIMHISHHQHNDLKMVAINAKNHKKIRWWLDLGKIGGYIMVYGCKLVTRNITIYFFYLS